MSYFDMALLKHTGHGNGSVLTYSRPFLDKWMCCNFRGLLAGDVKQSRNDVAIRLIAESVRSCQTLVLLLHQVFLISQYQSEYAT